MNRVLILSLVMLVFVRSLPGSASASKPVTQTLEGCVIKGVFYSVEKKVATKTGPSIQVYRIEAKKPDFSPYDLSPYEGKKIRVQGRLHPGDLFEPDPKTRRSWVPVTGNPRTPLPKAASSQIQGPVATVLVNTGLRPLARKI